MDRCITFRPQRDWVGHYLSLVEKRGEDMGIRYGHLDRPAAETIYGCGLGEESRDPLCVRRLPHSRYDGLSGFAKIFCEDGLPSPDAWLESKTKPKVGLWQALRSLGYLALEVPKPQPRAATFWGHDTLWTAHTSAPAGSSVARADAHAFLLYSRQDTGALRQTATRLRITVNSLLLWGLTRALASELRVGAPIWLIPVNLRGVIRQKDVYSNHISFLEIPASASLTPIQVHNNIKRRLDRGLHLAMWLLCNVGEVIGQKGVSCVTRLSDPRKRTTCGVFSNLGAVEVDPATPLDRDRTYFFCPPVSYSQPFAAGTLTWRGRLSLFVQLHPSLRRSAAQAMGIVRRMHAQVAAV